MSIKKIVKNSSNKKVASQVGLKKTKSHTLSKPIKVVKSGKPKIKIKKVSAKLDSSVVNLKKHVSKHDPKEDDNLFDDEEGIEETPVTEDMDFDWEELLDSDVKTAKSHIDKASTKAIKTKHKKSFLPFLHKKKHDKPSDDKQASKSLPSKTIDKPVKSSATMTDKLTAKPIKSSSPYLDEHPHLSMKIYRKLAIVFVVLVIILVVAIGYFAMAKATIVVKLAEENMEQTVPISIYDRGEDYIIPEDAIRGIIKEISVEESKVYEVVGSEVIGEEVTGTVTLVNKYNKNQPLVATTRLLSPTGQLFRLKSSVMVPAGQSVTAEVYADKPSEETVVGDTRFTIPGLWEGLQEQIYAESKAGDITFKKKLKKIVKQEEIDTALADIETVLINKAKIDIDQTYSDYPQKLYQINKEEMEYEVEAEVGDEVDKFTVTMKATILVVAFVDGQVYELTQASLTNNLTEDQQLLGLRPEEFTYELLSIDLEKGVAEVEVGFKAKISYKNGSDIINKEEIVNMSREELSDYLSKKTEISSYDIKISPSFLNKTPRLVDRIKIEIIE